ncbi:hypothetical protein HanLR1_Chr00c0026g0693711 [Helianthus annuus]|nr:hypothetical protein HanLR1_Chr00c0026g0693711 [Helianthus annuus]
MGTIGFANFGFCLKPNKQKVHATHSVIAATKIDADSEENVKVLGRRTALVSGVSLVSSATLIGFPKDGLAVVKQGLLAGRIPGLSEPNEQGWLFSGCLNVRLLNYGCSFIKQTNTNKKFGLFS